MSFKTIHCAWSSIGFLALSACGGGNAGGGGTTPPPPPPPQVDTVAPIVSFSPATLTLTSGKSGSSTLTASDNVGVVNGPTIECTNEGSYSGSIFTAPIVTENTTSICTATALDAAGNSSSASLTVTVLPPPIIAIAVSNVAIVMEGQPFTLDGSETTNTNGGALTYDWVQTSGTPVTIATASTLSQNLTAPLLTADESLEFQLTVSDGTDSSTDTIIINVEDIQAAQTISRPSVFNRDKRLGCLKGLNANTEGGYTAYWARNYSNNSTPVSAQSFGVGGNRVGAQIDGEFQANSNQRGGELLKVLRSGDTVYYVNRILLDSNSIPNGAPPGRLATYRGIVSGVVSGLGDEYASHSHNIIQVGTTPVGTNQIISVHSEYSPNAITGNVVQPGGTSLSTTLAPTDENTTTDPVTTALIDGSYMTFWSMRYKNGGYEIRMQRSAIDGNLLGANTLVNEAVAGFGTHPDSVTMQNGNVFVAWRGAGGAFGDTSLRAIIGRVIRPDGSFVTDEFIINTTTLDHQIAPHVTVLHENKVLVTWLTIPQYGERDIRAQVISGVDGSFVGNEFLIASGNEAFNAMKPMSTTLADGRVILGWTNGSGAYPIGKCAFSSPSHIVGLYPLGK